MHFSDQDWMRKAIELAHKAEIAGEVPVGAIVVKNNELISEGFNQPINSQDPSAHAEIVALREAAKKINNYRLIDTTMYVTLEPCAMCIGALIHARIKRLVYGAKDPKTGAVESIFQIPSEAKLNHKIEIQGGMLSEDCSELLKNFFKARRN